MTYQEQYKNKGVRWRVAVYIKRHLNFRLGNVLLNTIC